MNQLLRNLLAAVLSGFAASAFAHPGHDAAHWSAEWMHAAYYGGIFLGAFFLGSMLFRKLKAEKIRKQ